MIFGGQEKESMKIMKSAWCVLLKTMTLRREFYAIETF